MGRRVRAARWAAVVAVCALLLTACGSSDEPAADKPVEATSTPSASATSEAPSPTPEAQPKPTTKPLSRFEDEAPVKVARAWAAAYGTAVNEGDENFASLAAFTTPAGRDRMVGYGAEDAGLFYPGPMPFTPVGVRVDGATATVPMCMWLEGFAVERKSKQPPKPKLVDGVDMVLKKQGQWKVDAVIVAEDVDCSRVSVKGRGW
jgi:hypothetical protein